MKKVLPKAGFVTAIAFAFALGMFSLSQPAAARSCPSCWVPPDATISWHRVGTCSNSTHHRCEVWKQNTSGQKCKKNCTTWDV